MDYDYDYSKYIGSEQHTSRKNNQQTKIYQSYSHPPILSG